MDLKRATKLKLSYKSKESKAYISGYFKMSDEVVFCLTKMQNCALIL